MRKSETTTSELLMSRMAVLTSSHRIAGREAERFLAELALKLSEKKQIKYSIARNSFATEEKNRFRLNLLRSAVLCVRGSKVF